MSQVADGDVAVIGAGPAGLMAAETLARAGRTVVVYERMPSVGRKFLMAGRGGLNLTHSEPLPTFLTRYGAARGWVGPLVEAFTPAELIAWAEALGQPTFTGSSGRVFPKTLKASPLLRAWLAELARLGVEVRTRHLWTGWTDDGALRFETPDGAVQVRPVATVLALGGASWPRLGSDGAWTSLLDDVAPLRPANVGFDLAWSEVFRDRFEGQPLKNVALHFGETVARGDIVVTRHGLEGGAVYAVSAALRDAIDATGEARIRLDLRPDQDVPALTARLDHGRKGESLSNRLRKAGLSALEVNLLREAAGPGLPTDAKGLVKRIKDVRLRLGGVQPITRAISSAGGVRASAVDEGLMLTARPGVFVAGEMLDWEAPTGGYLLQASFATGRAAGEGALRWLAGVTPPSAVPA
ncbi:NAD(P)/FAD-dependent oxidoreductase [Phenylobacterium sp.]|jgi:uncharacterized flavoprotein (TIGR03862 family)|uniref:NAD(P)/FAD-dependent oxidoreductase n=1 Tax=Phenylobacterium sp. TaxID=1871053 RepID=UPI003782E8B3